VSRNRTRCGRTPGGRSGRSCQQVQVRCCPEVVRAELTADVEGGVGRHPELVWADARVEHGDPGVVAAAPVPEVPGDSVCSLGAPDGAFGQVNGLVRIGLLQLSQDLQVAFVVVNGETTPDREGPDVEFLEELAGVIEIVVVDPEAHQTRTPPATACDRPGQTRAVARQPTLERPGDQFGEECCSRHAGQPPSVH
jgi:hypothetical protein